MRIGSTPSGRAALCLIAAVAIATGCTTTTELPKVVIATTIYGVADTTRGSGTSGGYEINGTLPDQPTHARVYVWPSNKPSQSDVAKLASMFGLSGTPNQHAHGWDVSSASGELRMRDDEGQLWQYNAATANQSRCHAANFDIDNLPGDGPHGMCSSEPLAVTPSGGAAEAATNPAAASLLTALGFRGDQHAFANQLSSYVTISPTVAGLPTQGIELYVEGDAHGVSTVTGHSAPTAGHEYPLRTARAALEALPRPFRPDNSPEPIEIAGAHLGLKVEDEADTPGPTILVPAWFYTLADGTTAATAIAVDPAYIDAPPPGPAIVTTGGGA